MSAASYSVGAAAAEETAKTAKRATTDAAQTAAAEAAAVADLVILDSAGGLRPRRRSAGEFIRRRRERERERGREGVLMGALSVRPLFLPSGMPSAS